MFCVLYSYFSGVLLQSIACFFLSHARHGCHVYLLGHITKHVCSTLLRMHIYSVAAVGSQEAIEEAMASTGSNTTTPRRTIIKIIITPLWNSFIILYTRGIVSATQHTII